MIDEVDDKIPVFILHSVPSLFSSLNLTPKTRECVLAPVVTQWPTAMHVYQLQPLKNIAGCLLKRTIVVHINRHHHLCKVCTRKTYEYVIRSYMHKCMKLIWTTKDFVWYLWRTINEWGISSASAFQKRNIFWLRMTKEKFHFWVESNHFSVNARTITARSNVMINCI